MENIIESITVGNTENSIFFSTKPQISETYKVDEIKEETKQVSVNNLVTVYRGYINGKLRVEVEAGNGITIYYKL